METKVKITQKEFDEFYEIEGITGDTQGKPAEAQPDDTKTEDTTPEFLSKEEEEQDENLAQLLNWDDEEKKE